MFAIGWTEMLVIAVALVVAVKPEQMPEVARTLGRAYGKLQRLIYESRRILEKEAGEIKRPAPGGSAEAEAGAAGEESYARPGADKEGAAGETEDDLNLQERKER